MKRSIVAALLFLLIFSSVSLLAAEKGNKGGSFVVKREMVERYMKEHKRMMLMMEEVQSEMKDMIKTMKKFKDMDSNELMTAKMDDMISQCRDMMEDADSMMSKCMSMKKEMEGDKDSESAEGEPSAHKSHH